MSDTAVTQRHASGTTIPRLLAELAVDERPLTLDEHLERYGPLRETGLGDVIAQVEASGLRGRGGAGFPTGTKLRAVAAQSGRAVVVANGTEGEPLSGKDKVLLAYLPHLVLDGAVAAAVAVGGREAIIATSRSARAEAAAIAAAIRERSARHLDGRIRLRHEVVPDGFVVGEETALISALSGRAAKPTFTPPLPFERGLRGAPTLVQNVETLANVALIARYGSEWFRGLGTRAEPGSILVTLSGVIGEPGVYEVELGSSIGALVKRAGGATEPVSAVLVGGYFGTWLPVAQAESLHFLDADLHRAGATLGARAVVVYPRSACGVGEVARVMRYLADQSAKQCGPCIHGLAAIADGYEALAHGDPLRRTDLNRWLAQVRGRGACRHPDGAVQFAASAAKTFAGEIEQHVRHGRCTGTHPPLLSVARPA